MESEPAKPNVPISIAREQQLIRLLMAYLITGLLFMVLPGTFLGVWNLFAISNAQSATSVPAAWIQAHGHAQLFGWIGSFILGIGFYSIPNVRRVSAWSFWEGWLTWTLWTAGVTLRWLTDVYLWQWRILLPLSAVFEVLAVVLFLAQSIQGHRMQNKLNNGLEPWALLVVSGTVGLLITMLFNAFESFRLAVAAISPAFPAEFDGRFLILSIWAFPVPIAWGFTARWMPVFLGLKPLRSKLILAALTVNIIGIVAALAKPLLTSSILLLVGAICMVSALRIFEGTEKPAKTQGVHKTFPMFIRIAYVWLLIAGLFAVWASVEPGADGVAGAGRHAITVGFLMTMVFSVAPRMVPAFLGRKKLFSECLMFLALLLTNTGCLLRVSSETLAYQHYASWAWALLPISATLELVGVVIFTVNMIGTFLQPPLLAPAK
ncbi:MAG: NnrS family protein [Candidatus Obscuribacterales bacterium]|nr:NnrS family protein [Candidatus Obscuribacterales bacterium]